MDLPEFRFINPEVGVYLYYAGRDRKYMKLSQVEEAVFLDIPGFLATNTTFSSDESIVRSLNRADATKRYLRDSANNPRPAALNQYSALPPQLDGRVDRSFVADFGNVKTMFVDILIGDIVIMTPTDHYAPLLIGEVQSAWTDSQTLALPEQGENSVPYRSVRWLSHTLSRRDFPNEVARRLQNRKAITRVDPDYYDSIFRYLYHAYVWGNTSKLDIFGPQYNSNDPTATAEASFIIKYAVAYYAAYKDGRIDEFNDLSIEDAADRFFDSNIALQIAQSFGSPGGYIAKLIGSGAAISVAMIVGVALSNEAHSTSQVHHEVITQVQKTEAQHGGQVGLDLTGLGNSFRAGNSEQIRTKYGRAARAKLGMTLHGNRAPELSATQRIVRD